MFYITCFCFEDQGSVSSGLMVNINDGRLKTTQVFDREKNASITTQLLVSVFLFLYKYLIFSRLCQLK